MKRKKFYIAIDILALLGILWFTKLDIKEYRAMKKLHDAIMTVTDDTVDTVESETVT